MVDRYGACQRGDGALRCHVGGAVLDPDIGDGRGRVHDHAPALLFHDVLAAEEHTLDVHREQRVPIRLGRVHDGAGESVAGIVDQDLEAAIPLGYP